MTQEVMVYDHLKAHGSIDPLTAFEQYRIMRLSAVIFDLKKAGVPIETVMHHRGKKNWAEYRLCRPTVCETEGRHGSEATEGFGSENNTI